MRRIAAALERLVLIAEFKLTDRDRETLRRIEEDRAFREALKAADDDWDPRPKGGHFA